MMRTKIALYGFGSMPVVYRHLIDMARADAQPFDWCVILTLPHYRQIMHEVLPAADILDVYRELPREPVGAPVSELSGYVGSLAEDLAAEKRRWRWRSGQWLLNRGIDYYLLYKRFLKESGASHLLTPNAESPDGKIAIAAAKELGMRVLCPSDLRNLTGTMFASDVGEAPPAHAIPTAESRKQAAALIAQFREQTMPARSEPTDIEVGDGDDELLAGYLPPLRDRVTDFVRHAMERPDLFDPVMIRVSIMNNFGWLRQSVRGIRARLNASNFDIGDIAGLPDRFIFYPLQYSPESSINTPAPYFVDQIRVIDAIRFAMPSDCMLVVKEHWACIEMRPLSFMRRVRQLAGVRIANYKLPTRSIIERAALTISVTGTATLEAALLGRPAMTLGAALPSSVLDGQERSADMKTRIAERIDRPLPNDVLIDRIARLLNVRYPFFFATPHMAGEPVLRWGNMRRLFSALVDHIERERGVVTPAPSLPPTNAGSPTAGTIREEHGANH
jgi:hypothetical protein